MQALWCQKFDYSGKVEAVVAWAQAIKKRGIEAHLILVGVPPFLLPLCQGSLEKKGLKGFLNISSQQFQNLLHYQGYELVHVFNPELYPLAAALCSARKVPWVATSFEGEEKKNFFFLEKASYITCASGEAYNSLRELFFKKERVELILPGAKISPPTIPTRKQMAILFAASPLNGKSPLFRLFDRVTQKLKGCSLGLFSWQRPAQGAARHHPWTPDFAPVLESYHAVAGCGYYLLLGMAAGKIALLAEETYEGILSPFTLPGVFDFRARGQGSERETEEKLREDLKWLLEHPLEAGKIMESNIKYARENHDLDVISEQIARLYRRRG